MTTDLAKVHRVVVDPIRPSKDYMDCESFPLGVLIPTLAFGVAVVSITVLYAYRCSHNAASDEFKETGANAAVIYNLLVMLSGCIIIQFLDGPDFRMVAYVVRSALILLMFTIDILVLFGKLAFFPSTINKVHNIGSHTPNSWSHHPFNFPSPSPAGSSRKHYKRSPATSRPLSPKRPITLMSSQRGRAMDGTLQQIVSFPSHAYPYPYPQPNANMATVPLVGGSSSNKFKTLTLSLNKTVPVAMNSP